MENMESSINNMSAPIKSSNSIGENLQKHSDVDNINSVELNDFFKFLDSKTIEKIMNTSSESKNRILNDVANMEHDIQGAKAILESLR